jgi:hypothetical protein
MVDAARPEDEAFRASRNSRSRMTLERPIVYALAALLIAIGLLKRSNSVRARKMTGNLAVGDNSGTINQNYRATGEAKEGAPPDRVAWWIAIIGVLIAAAQLAHDVLAK